MSVYKLIDVDFIADRVKESQKEIMRLLHIEIPKYDPGREISQTGNFKRYIFIYQIKD